MKLETAGDCGGRLAPRRRDNQFKSLVAAHRGCAIQAIPASRGTDEIAFAREWRSILNALLRVNRFAGCPSG
jgi:hypothetical protein